MSIKPRRTIILGMNPLRPPKGPPDPIAIGAARGVPHRTAATGGVLFHQSHMPYGQHTGKIMERVPAKYLLWVFESHWSTQWKWREIRSYVERHLEEIQARAAQEE